jgi:hypothetical protein
MGGKNAQLAFYYQNVYAIYQILRELKAGLLISVELEKVVEGAHGQELDIHLQLKDKVSNFYEIKSGLQFTDSVAEIKKTIKKFIIAYSKKSNEERHKYFLIIHPRPRSPILQVRTDLQRIIEKRRRYGVKVTSYCRKWKIRDKEKFETVLENTEIQSVNDLGEIISLCKAELSEIVKDLVMNADHGLSIDDLLNRLVNLLILSLKHSNGKVDLAKFVDEIHDWIARNRVASRTASQSGLNIETELKKEKEALLESFRAKFPTIDLSKIAQKLDSSIMRNE